MKSLVVALVLMSSTAVAQTVVQSSMTCWHVDELPPLDVVQMISPPGGIQSDEDLRSTILVIRDQQGEFHVIDVVGDSACLWNE